MIESLLHGAASGLLGLWLRTSKRSWRRLPRPSGAPQVHASGATPDRLLVVGSGAVVGYGVLSWDLSISGQLAKGIAAATGRGIDIDIAADSQLGIDAAVEVISNVDLARYDGIVFLIGALEALELYPPRRWTAQLLTLLDRIRADGPSSLRVSFVAVPPLTELVSVPRPMRAAVVRHIDSFNRITAEAMTGRKGMQFIPLHPTARDLVGDGGREVHTEWAALIAPAVAAALDSDAPRPAELVDEGARMAALHKLHVFDSPPAEQLRQLVDSAREVFAVAGASFNVIDEDLHRVRAAAGLATEPAEMPRAESFCNVTIAQSRLFVIPDMTKEPDYRDQPFVTGPPALRFYAGYPVEAPDGHRIGSLCLIDTQPRTFGNAEAALLRDMALRVQAMVWDGARRPAGRTS